MRVAGPRENRRVVRKYSGRAPKRHALAVGPSIGTRCALTLCMISPGNDNGSDTIRVLEARFHPNGKANEFVVIGRILCRALWAVLDVAPEFASHLPRGSSAKSTISNLNYLLIMSRPHPFERLLSIDSRYWSFVVSGDLFGIN